jgi:hypothetical protein
MKESNAKISGILSIISGSMGLMTFVGCMLVVLLFGLMMAPITGLDDFSDSENTPEIFRIIYAAIGIVFLVIGIFSIIGGIFALIRRYWGVTLAAAIVSILCFFPTGIPAVIFAANSQQDFPGRQKKVSSLPVLS